jgi:hypothetical protein
MCNDCTREEMAFLVAILAAAKDKLAPEHETKRRHLHDILKLSIPPMTRRLGDEAAAACAAAVMQRADTIPTRELIDAGQCCDELGDVFNGIEAVLLALIGKRASEGDAEAEAVVERSDAPTISVHVLDMEAMKAARDRSRMN